MLVSLVVRIRIMGEADPSKYFEGFFTQAKSPGNGAANHGTFDHLDTEGIQTLECFSNANVSVIIRGIQ